MTASAIISEIITILTGAITQMASAIGTGVSDFVSGIFFQGTGDQQSLSVFAIVTLVFAGVALAIGLGRLILHWLSTLGGSNV